MHLRTRKLLTLVLVSAAALWAADPVVGTWKLNLAKSKYNPGLAPKSETRVYEVQGAGIKLTVNGVAADGQRISVGYTAETDAKDYAITGLGTIDAIKLTKIDDHSAAVTLSHGSVPVARAVRTVSPDGRTLTITYKGTDGEGRQVDNVRVYDKQ